jgi:hypothetical protein
MKGVIMENVRNILNEVNNKFNDINLEELDPTKYWNLSQDFNALEGSLREHVQAETADQTRAIIEKLRSKVDLTKDELDFVKLWICGEAEHYVKMENDYKNWQQEVVRLVGEVNKYAQGDLDYKKASEMRAVSLDAVRVLGDIVFYQRQMQRVENFVESTESIDDEERVLLVELLVIKLNSATE